MHHLGQLYWFPCTFRLRLKSSGRRPDLSFVLLVRSRDLLTIRCDREDIRALRITFSTVRRTGKWSPPPPPWRPPPPIHRRAAATTPRKVTPPIPLLDPPDLFPKRNGQIRRPTGPERPSAMPRGTMDHHLANHRAPMDGAMDVDPGDPLPKNNWSGQSPRGRRATASRCRQYRAPGNQRELTHDPTLQEQPHPPPSL